MPAVDHDVAEIERMFSVNVFGAMRIVRAFYRMLIRAKGVIVNIGSIRGIVPYIYGGTLLP
jgi:1-acylglycerone phosphate reductase